MDQWTDKEDDYAGTEIGGEIRFKEDRGSAEHFLLESLEHHLYLRPYDEEDRSTTGHTSLGYRDDFSVDIKAYLDGEPWKESAKVSSIPFDGDLVFDRNLEAHRIQLAFEPHASEWRLVRRRSYYVAKDRAATPAGRLMSTKEYQNTLATGMLIWLSRGLTPQLNRCTGTNAGGSYAARTTGADGRSNTGMSFLGTAGEGLTVALGSNLSGDFTLCGWVQATTATMYSFGTGGLTLGVNAAGQVVINDGAIARTFDTGITSGYIFIGMYRSGTMITPFYNKTRCNPFVVGTTYGGTVTIMGGGLSGNLFDLRCYNKAVSSTVLDYYYDDVIDNKGNATMPI